MILPREDIKKLIQQEKWEFSRYLMKLSCNESFLGALKTNVIVPCSILVHGSLSISVFTIANHGLSLPVRGYT